FPNLIHAQALVGHDEGAFARALGEIKLETKQFNAGPAEMQALSAGSIDVAYAGTGPAINSYLKTDRELRIVAGAVSGGALLVAQTARSPADLKGKVLATPQFGNSQDIALRHWLKTQGLSIAEDSKGDVRVTPTANPHILSLFISGRLEAAWVPEPWGARLIHEGGGHVLVDERDLWPNGAFPTTVLVTTTKVLQTRPQQVAAVLGAHIALTTRWRSDPVTFAHQANEAYGRLTGKRLSEATLRDAFSRMAPTLDPMPKALAVAAKHAQELGFTPSADVSGLVEMAPLRDVLATKNVR
ncbi:MAG TPA: ABC transporter substrate-binding protein, partial [Myxococcaceae bacterium]|nr:ABC transporter substrate-binding protein [Myxococcaceae bacterium]